MLGSQMYEKSRKFGWILRSNLMVQWWFKLLILGVFLGILIVWNTDGLSFHLGALQKDFSVLKLSNRSASFIPTFKDFTFTNVSLLPLSPPSNLTQTFENLTHPQDNLGPQISNLTGKNESLVLTVKKDEALLAEPSLSWISAGLEANYSSNLLQRWKMDSSGEPCRQSKTADISIPGLDGRTETGIELSTGYIHDFIFQALDESGKPHCLGGDYFETDLSGEKWKSRPPIKDFGNGTYRFSLQIHPDFSGDYNLTIILLFQHYEGLKFSPQRFAIDKVLRVIPVKFKTDKPAAELPELSWCGKSDFGSRVVWSGRWTRHAKNDSCPISHSGRFRCQDPNFPCQKPWCDGPLGSLESNGWVYSTHCSFKLYSGQDAWNCLSNRWIFWWGDSNHVDTIRNMLNFILGFDMKSIPRRYDMNITNPKNPSQTVRFTSIFNGHHNETANYLGLNSLSNSDYRELLKSYFAGNVVPDTIIMNSGLHDGVYWRNLRSFIDGANYACAFWGEVLEGVKSRGLVPPEIIYRTTITTGGYARRLAFNPHKMEAFNGVVLDKLQAKGLLKGVIDDFDMTYAWHYDNRCNDGVHYGRAPQNFRWRDGQIGHQYFVDLMLCHVLLNSLCAK
ncbi:unnamed protein product [Cuscuta epithymum]|uniref:Uncharacterized protein n=1 Tax=Cuscuta epithymum TaxID=186058 RepID=A0AAV0EEV2_9ASTE|nr:unnamed protein product [Cuscuta epithymum]